MTKQVEKAVSVLPSNPSSVHIASGDGGGDKVSDNVVQEELKASVPAPTAATYKGVGL